jgi:hypothetical protein
VAVAVVQDFPGEETDRSTENYDAIHQKLMERVPADADTGLIVHTAGWTGNGFRIFEVWESMEKFESFMSEYVWPTVAEVTAGRDDGAPPVTTTYELHTYLVP